MELVLFRAPGRIAKLTTDDRASHYGLPVLVLQSEVVSGAFGPADPIPLVPFPASGQSAGEAMVDAATVVAIWGDRHAFSDQALTLVRSFLNQWKEGPRLARDGGLAVANG